MTATRARDLLSTRFDTPGNAAFTRLVSQRLGAVIAAAAFALRLTPNAVTVLGLLLALWGSYCFAVADSIELLIVTGLLWQIAFAFDCADGQLARATRRQSAFGGWLDVACDHIRNAAMSLAILHVLLRDASMTTIAGNAAALAYLAGASVYLHTASSPQVRSARALQTRGLLQWLRSTIRFVTDAPVLMLALSALQPWPLLLGIYCMLMGGFLGVRALTIARQRLINR